MSEPSGARVALSEAHARSVFVETPLNASVAELPKGLFDTAATRLGHGNKDEPWFIGDDHAGLGLRTGSTGIRSPG